MGKIIKKIACLTLAVCSLFGLFGCTSFLYPTSTSETSSENLSVLPEGIELNFEINVTNSLDIVPDGVAVLDHIRPSVVEIYAVLTGGTSSGSGVILSTSDTDEDGEADKAIVVTCHHVIEWAHEVVVKAIDGKEYYATLVGSDPNSDIAVLYIEATENNKFENLTSATWYDRTSELKVGTEVYAIGNPLGTLGGTVTSGIISAINRGVEVEGNKMTLIQTDAAINGGNSGGGLFDKNTGALIGIVNAGYASSTAQGLSFAIPGSQAIDIIEQIISKGYIDGRYDFGVEFSLYRLSSWTTTYYVGISALEDYGLFEKNGFLEEDLILSIKIGDRETFDATVTSANRDSIISKLNAYLGNENCKIGDKVTVVFRRYGKNNSYQDFTVNFNIEQYVYGK